MCGRPRWLWRQDLSLSRPRSAVRLSQRFEHREEVVGWLALERHAFARSGMGESKGMRVEHRPHRLDPWTGVIADIHAFADEGMTKFGFLRTTDYCWDAVNPLVMLPLRR